MIVIAQSYTSDGRRQHTAAAATAAESPAFRLHAVFSWLACQSPAFWVWVFIALGVSVRLLRYLLRFPLWEDEAFLAYNLMNRDFWGLLQPLDFIQVAPLGYLWLQRGVIAVLGFTEYSLRFTALLAGLASLLIFRRVAKLVLPGRGQLFAVAVFAVSYPMVRYSAEAKQYGIDLLLSLCLLWSFLEWLRPPHRMTWCGCLLGLAAIGPWLSHPVVFLAGGISLVWGWLAVQNKSPGGRWPAWLLYNLLLLGSFVGHYALARQAMGAHNDAYMHDYWQQAFAPVSQPWRLPGWLIAVHAGDFHAYPVGCGNGGSSLTLLALLAGAWTLGPRGRRLMPLALLPLGLHLLASAWHKYPYGGHVKFGMYWAPLGVLLVGAGLASICSWLDRRRSGLAARLSLASLALIALGILTQDFLNPAKTRSDQRSRDFARWFWFDAPHDGVCVCLHSDLGRACQDLTCRLTWYANYACNLRIYSPRHARQLPPDLAKVDAGKPLHCVEYRIGDMPYDEAAQRAWLAEMGSRFQLAAHDRFPLTRYDKNDRRRVTIDFLEVYRFLPLAQSE